MNELKQRIHDDSNGLDYVLVGDYYIPDLRIDEPEKSRPIGKWGRMHLHYLKEHCPTAYAELLFSGRISSYLAEINKQAQERYERIIGQMKERESVTEELKRSDWWLWVQRMNSIQCRAEEIIQKEIIYS